MKAAAPSLERLRPPHPLQSVAAVSTCVVPRAAPGDTIHRDLRVAPAPSWAAGLPGVLREAQESGGAGGRRGSGLGVPLVATTWQRGHCHSRQPGGPSRSFWDPRTSTGADPPPVGTGGAGPHPGLLCGPGEAWGHVQARSTATPTRFPTALGKHGGSRSQIKRAASHSGGAHSSVAQSTARAPQARPSGPSEACRVIKQIPVCHHLGPRVLDVGPCLR